KLGAYSIDKIGKRTKVETSESASTLFRVQPSNLVVMTEEELANLGGEFILENLEDNGQAYAVIRDLSFQMFLPVVYTAPETRGQYPYTMIQGDPGKNGNQYFSDTKAQKLYPVGGYFSGDFLTNLSRLG